MRFSSQFTDFVRFLEDKRPIFDMLIRKPDDIKSSEVTNESLYLNRRSFLRGAVLIATTTATGLLYRTVNSPNQKPPAAFPLRPRKPEPSLYPMEKRPQTFKTLRTTTTFTNSPPTNKMLRTPRKTLSRDHGPFRLKALSTSPEFLISMIC